MFRILLRGGDRQMAGPYGRMLVELARKHGIPASVSLVENEPSLLSAVAADPPDVVYLDADAPPKNGVETARLLRSRGVTAELVFLARNADHVFEAFDVSPVQFLLTEETTPARFEEVFLRAVSRADDRKKDMFVSRWAGARRVTPLRDIAFFEIRKRVVTAHDREDACFEFYGQLDKLEKQLAGEPFIRTHRSFMVHTPYIECLQADSLRLTTGVTVPVGVTYAASARRAFLAYFQAFDE